MEEHLGKNTAYITLQFLLFLVTVGSCTAITGDLSSPVDNNDTNPLPLMLRVVPSNGVTGLMYSNIDILSDY
jgi:hypothetical protein